MVRKPQIKLLTKYLMVSDSDLNSKSLMLDNSTNTNQIALCFTTKEIITGKTPINVFYFRVSCLRFPGEHNYLSIIDQAP